jgi:hypothetical protein
MVSFETVYPKFNIVATYTKMLCGNRKKSLIQWKITACMTKAPTGEQQGKELFKG